MAYSPVSHLPRSIDLQRGEQKGNDLFAPRGPTAAPQIGQIVIRR